MSKHVFRVPVNPAVIRWARESAGYDTTSIAKATGTSDATVVAWEAGDEKPTMAQLRRMAAKVGRPIAALFLFDPPPPQVLPHDYRTLRGRPPAGWSPATLKVFRLACDVQSDAAQLASALGYDLPTIATTTLDANPAEFAREARKKLGVTIEDQTRFSSEHDAFRLWRLALEQQGILTLQFSMPGEEARGFSLYDDVSPLIAVTSKDAYTARIFSLFHEYGHLALRVQDGAVCTPSPSDRGAPSPTEVFCNAFAGAFLVPYWIDEVRSALERIARIPSPSVDDLRPIAWRLKVSRHVVLRRLLDLSMIEATTYSQLSDNLGSFSPGRGGGGTFYSNKIAQYGRRFVGLVLEGVHGGAHTSVEAARCLGVSPHHLNRLQKTLAGDASD